MRCIKLDVRIDLFDETTVQVTTIYAPLPTALLEQLADTIRKFAADNREVMSAPASHDQPSTYGVKCPP